MDNGLNLKFDEENICPNCKSNDVTSEIENLSEDKNLQIVSKFCKKCNYKWGYSKDLKNNNTIGLNAYDSYFSSVDLLMTLSAYSNNIPDIRRSPILIFNYVMSLRMILRPTNLTNISIPNFTIPLCINVFFFSSHFLPPIFISFSF